MKLPAIRLSVAMCTYNGEVFLPQQLASIAGQTSLPDELVICDDGSTDGTISILEAFAEGSLFPVRLHRNVERLRFAQNFAKCVSLCHGDVIVLTDQDDVWVSTRIQDTREAYVSDTQLMFTFSDAPLIDGEGKLKGENIYSNFPIRRRDRKRFVEGIDLFPVIARWGVVYGCTMTFRAAMRDMVLPIPYGWSHDEWLSLSLSALGKSKKLRPQTEYRQHGINSVGVGDWSFAGKLRMAKSRNKEAYLDEITHVLRGFAAAQTQNALQVTLAPVLQRKAAFLVERNAARQRGVLGIGQLLRVVLTGGYRAYSAGLRSFVKDLAVMLGLM